MQVRRRVFATYRKKRCAFQRRREGFSSLRLALELLSVASEGAGLQDMSQLAVGMVMDRLLTDKALRLRFASDPVETLGELHAQGCELTPAEIDLFLESDAQMWFWIDLRIGDRIH